MLKDFLHLLQGSDIRLDEAAGELFIEGRVVPVRNGIPRFTPDASYSDGNFLRLRELHATLQLDSRNGTTDRMDTLMDRTAWPPEFFRGKTILECGCGAGPDTEVLLALGARVVAVDLAGSDIAQRNVGERPEVAFVQASIMDLPFRPGSFDIVFCHRVIQHTPDPEATLQHILRFVKPEGAVFVHSYARTFAQMFRWKYLLRPITRRLPPALLYRIIEAYAPAAFHLTNLIRRLPGGGWLNHIFVPFLNFRHHRKFATMSDAKIIEYGVHDTFDALSPAYDQPLSARRMREIAQRLLQRPFEVDERRGITLLRTIRPAGA